LALCRQTAIYAQGAGLGASKGKDISKYTEAGYSGYVHMAQEAVCSAVVGIWDCPDIKFLGERAVWILNLLDSEHGFSL